MRGVDRENVVNFIAPGRSLASLSKVNFAIWQLAT